MERIVKLRTDPYRLVYDIAFSLRAKRKGDKIPKRKRSSTYTSMTNVNVCVFEMHLTFRLDANSDSSWGSILSCQRLCPKQRRKEMKQKSRDRSLHQSTKVTSIK